MSKKGKKADKQSIWNERFWKGGIPQYQAVIDPHCKLHLGARLQFRNPILSLNSKEEIKASSNSRVLHTLITEDEFSGAKHQLELLWKEKLIPKPQSIVFKSIVFALPRNKGFKAVSKEIIDLKRDISAVQLALRSIATREESLTSIVEMNEHLVNAPNWEECKEVKFECAELINAHRLLSLTVVESIET